MAEIEGEIDDGVFGNSDILAGEAGDRTTELAKEGLMIETGARFWRIGYGASSRGMKLVEKVLEVLVRILLLVASKCL